MIMKLNKKGDTMADLVAVKENFRKNHQEATLTTKRSFYVFAGYLTNELF